MITRRDLKIALSEIESGSQFLREVPSTNGLGFKIQVMNKLVFPLEDRIYRLSSEYEYWYRKMLREYFRSEDCDIFEEEILEEDLSHPDLLVTSQKPLTLYQGKDYYERFLFYCDKEKLDKCFEKTQVFDFLHSNVGLNEEGQLKAFDSIANIYTRIAPAEVQLIGAQGEILYVYHRDPVSRIGK